MLLMAIFNIIITDINGNIYYEFIRIINIFNIYVLTIEYLDHTNIIQWLPQSSCFYSFKLVNLEMVLYCCGNS